MREVLYSQQNTKLYIIFQKFTTYSKKAACSVQPQQPDDNCKNQRKYMKALPANHKSFPADKLILISGKLLSRYFDTYMSLRNDH